MSRTPKGAVADAVATDALTRLFQEVASGAADPRARLWASAFLERGARAQGLPHVGSGQNTVVDESAGQAADRA